MKKKDEDENAEESEESEDSEESFSEDDLDEDFGEIDEGLLEKLKNLENSEEVPSRSFNKVNFNAPVLDRIETSRGEVLEQDVERFSLQNKDREEEKTSSKYITTKNAPEYSTGEELRRMQDSHMVVKDFESTSLTPKFDLHPKVERDFQINPELQEIRRGAERGLDRDYVAKTETLERNKKLPFEQEERKYQGRAI